MSVVATTLPTTTGGPQSAIMDGNQEEHPADIVDEGGKYLDGDLKLTVGLQNKAAAGGQSVQKQQLAGGKVSTANEKNEVVKVRKQQREKLHGGKATPTVSVLGKMGDRMMEEGSVSEKGLEGGDTDPHKKKKGEEE